MNKYGHIKDWDTSRVTDMSQAFMFLEYSSGDHIDISNWDTSSVTDMSSMFAKAENFNVYIGGWDTSKVKDMSSMFAGAKAFNQNIGNWDTSSVETMRYMFKDAEDFNQADIASWPLTDMIVMLDMFENAGLSRSTKCSIDASFRRAHIHYGEHVWADTGYTAAWGITQKEYTQCYGWNPFPDAPTDPSTPQPPSSSQSPQPANPRSQNDSAAAPVAASAAAALITGLLCLLL